MCSYYIQTLHKLECWNVGPGSLALFLYFSLSLFLSYIQTLYKLQCWNVVPGSLSLFLSFSISVFLSFSLSLFISLSLCLSFSLYLFLSFSLSLSLSRYPPAHPNNTTMASCMRAVAAVVHVAPFAAPHSDTVHPVWIAILFSSRFASLQLGRREETRIELVPDRDACAEKMWCVCPAFVTT